MTREEAIKELRGFIGQLTEGCQEAIKVLIPELKESEDERTRKAILEFFKLQDDNTTYSFIPKKSILAWLEKQKEQKPAEWNEEDEDKLRDILEMIKYTDALPPMDIPSCTGHLHLSNEYKEKLSSWLKTQLKPQPKNEWNEEDTKRIKQLIYDTEAIRAGYEKKKEQLGECFNESLIKDCDEQVAWLKSIKDRGNFPKSNTNSPSEWSEEDKETIDLTIAVLKENLPNDYFKTNPANTLNMGAIHTDQLINRLKSLHLQSKQEQKYYWKPTETDVALFNKAVTTNETLTPEERAQLDIIRSKFCYCRATNCNGIVQPEQKPETKLTGWVARDKDERLWVYEICPKKYSKWQQWIGNEGSNMHLDQESFPDLKWEDEPVKVEITIRKK